MHLSDGSFLRSELPSNHTEQKQRFITIPKLRRMLGMIAKNYSDAELQEALEILYGIAEVAYDEYKEGL